MSLAEALAIADWVIRVVMVAVILRRRLPPSTALAWLSIVFLQPEVGLALYLLLGGSRLGRRRIRRHRSLMATHRTADRMAAQRRHEARPAIELTYEPVILQAEQIGGLPTVGGNSLELIPDYDQTIDRLVADIDQAQHHAHLLFYIWADDATGQRVAQALARARQRGVVCRVLADAAGSRRFFGRSGLAQRLKAQGVQVVPALPVQLWRRQLARLDLRNHRKIAVIDGSVAWTGSQNIVDADYGKRFGLPWVDLMGRLTGPVVGQLQHVFLEDWYFETGQELDGPQLQPTVATMPGDISAQAVPTGPSDDNIEALPKVLLTAIHAARRRILITTPYLVPDEATFMGLSMAADRGVQVDLVVPRRSDHPIVSAAGRAYFDSLLEAGINIHLFGPGLLHAKTMTVDDSFALLGSSNMDIRSFYLNFEINVLMYGPQITGELRFAQMSYLSQSTPLDKEAWSRRPRLPRYADHAAALLSPLL